jgi:hypothetical protein
MIALVGIVTVLVEFLLIPGLLIFFVGWKLALGILAAFYFVVRPGVGAFRYSLAAAIVDNLFTLSVAVQSLLRGYWPVALVA